MANRRIEILGLLRKKISESVKIGIIKKDFFTNKQYLERRRCHSRMLGILAQVGHELGYTVDIERGIKPSSSRQFQPDITYWDKSGNKIVCLIEYESMNSSDERVIVKDVDNFSRYYDDQQESGQENDDKTPEFCIVITTVPKEFGKEKRKFWEYHYDRETNEKNRYRYKCQNSKKPNSECRCGRCLKCEKFDFSNEKNKSSPYDMWYPKFRECIEENKSHLKGKNIFMWNINGTEIEEVDLEKHEHPKN